jgi:hypothetical protein
MFLGSKVGLTTLPPSVSRLPRQCGILNISQAYRPPRPVTGIALLLFFFTSGLTGGAPACIGLAIPSAELEHRRNHWHARSFCLKQVLSAHKQRHAYSIIETSCTALNYFHLCKNVSRMYYDSIHLSTSQPTVVKLGSVCPHDVRICNSRYFMLAESRQ